MMPAPSVCSPFACVVCRVGQCTPGTTTVTLTRGDRTIVIRHVPADVCDACGEGYVPGVVAVELHRMAEAAIAAGVHYEVRDYVASAP